MVRPVSGRTTQKFGVRNPAYRLGYHPGTDYSAANGTKAKAASNGKWRYYPGNNGGYGNVGTITLSNGDVLWYAHLLRNLIKSGSNVKAGQFVAQTDSTGWVTGPHLHIEYRLKGSQNRPIDFEKKLAAAPRKKPTPKPLYYIIRRGDTLSGIARRFKTTLKVLLTKNTQYKRNPNLIYPGKKLRIK